ncbi:MAG: 50S ribosomal protein L25 [Deltaproteobacteria bacterium]|nr:50S ribosomal protein L25 [Deltaproteobacteria bacterium]
MEQYEITAWKRDNFGKGNSGRLRRDGFIPAVLYGAGIKENIHIKMSKKDVDKAISGHSGTNVLLKLTIEGDGDKTVMFKTFDRHPAQGFIRHIDLQGVDMKEKITVDVPIVLVGKAEGIKLGGILHQDMQTVRAECLPTAIPDSIELDITEVGLNQALHVSDIKLPEGLKILDDEKLTVVLVNAPAAEKEEEEVEGEGEEGAAEGEEAEAEEKKD